MRVLHIAESGDGGGAESVFRETVTMLKDLDHQRDHFVACKWSNALPFQIDFVFPEGDVRLIDLIYSAMNKKKLDSFLDQLKPDIIHLHHYANLSPSILHSLYNYKIKYNRTKIIQTAHTFEYICSHHAAYDYQQSKRCLDCSSQRFKTKIFYRNCSRLNYFHSVGKGINSLIAHYFYGKNFIDKIIVPSQFMKDSVLQNKSINSDQVEVIDNPVSKEFLVIDNGNIKKDQLIYFGRLSEEKNIELLISAYSHYVKSVVEPFTLVIIGNGVEKIRLEALVLSLKLNHCVKFIPFLSHKDLKGYLNDSKISILPSKCFENAPMMVVESLVANIIPIVSNHGGMKEMITRFSFGLVFDSDDIISLSKQISYAVSNYDELIQKANEARILATQTLSKEVYLNKLSNLYSIV